MSGICGLFNQGGRPVEPAELRNMASLLARRGPERTGIWYSGTVGLGHTLLATTPEAALERLPLRHAESGCVITGDVRLDNRSELLLGLSLLGRAPAIGDAEIVLAAYLAWEEACVERFLGDFAFAVWDPRHRRLFCARDHMGMRSLYYHHDPGRFFAFATEPRAILVLPQTPYRLNEARIADYLIGELESIDRTSSFFEEVFRLPPAHTLTVTPEGTLQRRYWRPEPKPELRLPSDQAYVEAFREVFQEAVRCRLRTVAPPGSMLSGGMDSGTIVATARQILASEQRGPLLTFSAVSPDGDADPETRSIQAAITMDGLDPHFVSWGDLDDLLPDLSRLMWDIDEPFDGHMTLIRSVDLAGHRHGLKTLLDGVSGDVLMSDGRYLARLLRAGRWGTAYREAAAQNRVRSGRYPPSRELLRNARAAFVPDIALRRLRPLRRQLLVGRTVRASLISEDFARRVNVGERLRTGESLIASRPLTDGGTERARVIGHPHMTAARERYDRVAAAVSMEPRDPFLDLRVMAFCISLPDALITTGGWSKVILRRAAAGQLPEAVRWRADRQNLGLAFTDALMQRVTDDRTHDPETGFALMDKYVDLDAARLICRNGVAATAEAMYSLIWLAAWLRGHAARPTPAQGKIDASSGQGGDDDSGD